MLRYSTDIREAVRSGGTACLRELHERGVATDREPWRLVDRSATPATTDSKGIGFLHGHFCVFGRWTEINSSFEGRFLEQIAPGSCKKTFAENRKGVRCLFQHGRDPTVGAKPLGPIRELVEDEIGGRYVVPLLDTSYNRDLLPGLRSEQYGASFRFRVIREEVNTAPKRSDRNPDGIEERTITEMAVAEFGPVTFPAYPDATAGVRSRSAVGAEPAHSVVLHAPSYPDLQRRRQPWRLVG